VQALYDRERAGALVSTRIEEPYWRWALDGVSPDSGAGWCPHLITTPDQHPVGYLLIGRRRWGRVLSVKGMAVAIDVSWDVVLPSVLRAVRALAPRLLAGPDAPPADTITFEMGRTHPVYEALGTTLADSYEPPDAWYVRVPDLPAFLRHIAPVLETRLARAGRVGYSGDLQLDFYQDGLRFAFEEGRLVTVEAWRPPAWGKPGAAAHAGFPPRVFLQLLLGYRSLSELRHAFPDVWVDEAALALLQTLFPPHASWVVPLD
jgi:hypothetical protein